MLEEPTTPCTPLQNWYTDPLKTVQDHYQDDVTNFPDPADPRLQPSTEAPVEPSRPPPRPDSDCIKLPDNKSSLSVLDMMEKLKRILPYEVHKSRSHKYKQSISDAQAIQALCNEYKLSESQATLFGEYLRKNQLLHSLGEGEGGFQPGEKCIYRLQCYQTPEILNSYRIWNTVVKSDCMGLLRRLKQMLDKVEKEVTSCSEEVNYVQVKNNKIFPVFEEACCELQGVNLTKLNANTLLAFGINCYNLMIKYAFFKLGIGSSSRSRSAFFNGVKFNIGTEIFSFQDWEHGFLRGNRKAPYSLKPQFKSKDPRYALAVANVDCRIHFALNCGAKSCPPVRNFTPEGIEDELRIVAQAFCEEDGNVEINLKKRGLSLNKILSWYRVDFASSERKLPVKVLEYLRGEKRAQLQQLLDDGKRITVSYKTYDWSANASEFVPFDSAVLRADSQQIRWIGSRFKTSTKHFQRSISTDDRSESGLSFTHEDTETKGIGTASEPLRVL